MGLGIALAALSFLVALGFLFAFLTREPPAPVESTPDAPAAEQPLFGPAVPVIYKHVPAKPKDGATNERGTDRTSERDDKPASPPPPKVRHEETFPDIPAHPGMDQRASSPSPRDLNRDDTPQPGPGAPHFDESDPDSPVRSSGRFNDNGSVRSRKDALPDFFRPPRSRSVPRP